MKEKSSRSRLAASVILLAICGSGCMTFPGGIADSTYPLTGNDSFTELGKAYGSAWGVSCMGIPLSEGGTRLALDRAKASSNADALIDVVVDETIIPLPIGITIFKTTADGTAIKINRGAK